MRGSQGRHAVVLEWWAPLSHTDVHNENMFTRKCECSHENDENVHGVRLGTNVDHTQPICAPRVKKKMKFTFLCNDYNFEK